MKNPQNIVKRVDDHIPIIPSAFAATGSFGRMNAINDSILVHPDETLKEALKKLDKNSVKLLLVTDESNNLKGTLSDGDIRRTLLQGLGLQLSIIDVYQKNPIFLTEKEFSIEGAREIFITKKINLIPIVSSRGIIVDYITWDQAFGSVGIKKQKKPVAGVPVVFMAGGKGTRLDPFTKILPKPLIPIGEKSILEHIIDEFKGEGFNKYTMILNYKGEMIEAYFKGIARDYTVDYVYERDFYGTAGGLRLLPPHFSDTFIVSNCDVVVKADYGDVVEFHRKSGAALTVLSAVQHFRVPYGIIDFVEGGNVVKILEKPEYSYIINTGVYVCSQDVLDVIPPDGYFDMPNVIEALMSKGMKVVTYPINENDYIDIGQWDEYKAALKKFDLTN